LQAQIQADLSSLRLRHGFKTKTRATDYNRQQQNLMKVKQKQKPSWLINQVS